MSKKTFTPHTPSLFSILGTPGVTREIEHKNRKSTMYQAPPGYFQRRVPRLQYVAAGLTISRLEIETSRVDLERALSTQRVDQLSECARP